jgi:hypothetical protein
MNGLQKLALDSYTDKKPSALRVAGKAAGGYLGTQVAAGVGLGAYSVAKGIPPSGMAKIILGNANKVKWLSRGGGLLGGALGLRTYLKRKSAQQAR